MKRHVAFQDVFGTPVAIVEVARAELQNLKQEEQLRQQFVQLPQFQEVLVVLGVPHEGQLFATFSAPPKIQKELEKIGWIRLLWQEIELPV